MMRAMSHTRFFTRRRLSEKCRDQQLLYPRKVACLEFVYVVFRPNIQLITGCVEYYVVRVKS
jgi:hypothetical protein